MYLMPGEWLYVSTMKCATNTLYRVLDKAGAKWAGGRNFHAVPAKLRLAPLHWTCCRNPYDRAVSIWASTCVREKERSNHACWGHILERGGDPLNFRDFARYVLVEQPESRIPWLIRNQSDWQDLFLHDLVVPVEFLYQDVWRHFSIKIDVKPLNTSEHKPWEEYYDDETIDRVTEWAGEDFERFGYPRL